MLKFKFDIIEPYISFIVKIRKYFWFKKEMFTSCQMINFKFQMPTNILQCTLNTCFIVQDMRNRAFVLKFKFDKTEPI